MGKGSAPSAPDYGPVYMGAKETAAADLEAAKLQSETAREQLAFQRQYADRSANVADRYAQMAEGQYAMGRDAYTNLLPDLQKYMQEQHDIAGLSMDVARTQAGILGDTAKQARETYNRYMTEFAPREKQFADAAFDYASPARMDQAAAEARGDVATSFAQQQNAAKRQLMSYGVDPSQGAFGRTQAMDIAKSAASAAAGTMARKQQEAQGFNLQSAALQMGQKLPVQAITAYGTTPQQATSVYGAGSTGGGAFSPFSNALSASGQVAGTGGQYASQANPFTSLSGQFGTSGSQLYGNQVSALGNAGNAWNVYGNALNSSFSNQNQAYQTKLASSPIPAIGSIAGNILPFFL